MERRAQLPDLKIPKKLGIIGSTTAGVALLAAACGGSEGAQNGQSSPTENPETLIPTETISPTTEQTLQPTPEFLVTEQAKDQVFELISSGLNETGLGPPQVTDLDATNPDKIRSYIKNCNTDRQPFDPWGDGTLLVPSDPNYGNILDGLCQSVGQKTSILYRASGNQKFLEANQSWERIHKAIYDDLSKDYSYLDNRNWQLIESQYYFLVIK